MQLIPIKAFQSPALLRALLIIMLSNFYGSIPDAKVATLNNNGGAMPFGDLTKLLNDQSKLTKLCKEMKGEMAELRKEVGSLKENARTLSSKVESKCGSLKKS